MALVRGRYYQHSIRIHKRVTTEYYGVGPAGASSEAMDALVRQAREHRRLAARELDGRQRQAYAAERERSEGLRRVATAILVGLGYWRPQCRVWRRRRMGVMQARSQAPPAPRDDDAAVRAEMRSLIRRVAAGPDDAAVERLALLAGEHLRVADRAIGCDLERLARESLAAMLFDREEDWAERDAMVARLALRARELAGPGASPEVQACATTTAYEEAGYHLLAATSTATREAFRTEHPRLTLRRSAALRRYLYSLRTLVEVKRLQRPVVAAARVVVNGQASPP
jgi:hypothetical protein